MAPRPCNHSFTSQNYSVGKKADGPGAAQLWDPVDGNLAGAGRGRLCISALRCWGMNTAEPEVIQCGTGDPVHHHSALFPVRDHGSLACGALRGMGHSAVPMVLSVIGTVVTRIIWIYGFFLKPPVLVFPVYFLSRLLDHHHPYAGDLLLVCKEAVYSAAGAAAGRRHNREKSVWRIRGFEIHHTKDRDH